MDMTLDMAMLETTKEGDGTSYLLMWEEEHNGICKSLMAHYNGTFLYTEDDGTGKTLRERADNFCKKYGAWREIPLASPLVTNFCGNCDGPIWDMHYLCMGCRDQESVDNLSQGC